MINSFEGKGTGDSGEDRGDGSVIVDESTVDIVLVGDESVDSEFVVDVLPRCWCRDWKWLSAEVVFIVVFVSSSDCVVVWVAAASPSTNTFSSPNIDINDGNRACEACGPFSFGMFEN